MPPEPQRTLPTGVDEHVRVARGRRQDPLVRKSPVLSPYPLYSTTSGWGRAGRGRTSHALIGSPPNPETSRRRRRRLHGALLALKAKREGRANRPPRRRSCRLPRTWKSDGDADVGLDWLEVRRWTCRNTALHLRRNDADRVPRLRSRADSPFGSRSISGPCDDKGGLVTWK